MYHKKENSTVIRFFLEKLSSYLRQLILEDIRFRGPNVMYGESELVKVVLVQWASLLGRCRRTDRDCTSMSA